MEIHKMLPEHYVQLLRSHQRAAQKIEMDLKFFLDDIGNINVFSVSHRTKEYSSALAKTQKLGIPIENLDDLVGIRIVVGVKAEVSVIERFFTRQADVKDIDIKKHNFIDRDDGYRSLHLVVELKGNYQRSIFPGRVEIQVQTIFEHAFNFLSRNWAYKQPWKKSGDWRVRFRGISRSLAEIDEKASSLHEEIILTQAGFGDSRLTPNLLGEMVEREFEEPINQSDAVDACLFFSDIGYKTICSLKNFLRRSDIEGYYRKFCEHNAAACLPHIPPLTKWQFWLAFGSRVDSAGFESWFNRFLTGSRSPDQL